MPSIDVDGVTIQLPPDDSQAQKVPQYNAAFIALAEEVAALSLGMDASSAHLSGNLLVDGTITGGFIVGDGAGLTNVVNSFNTREGAVVLLATDLNGLNGSGLTGIATGTGGVINTGSTTIGADSDSDGIGVVDLQTRGTSRLQVLNGGDVNVLNQLGINTASPTSALHITPTYAINTTAGEFPMRISPPNGIADFTFRLESTYYGTPPTDDVVMWGWNVDGTVGEPQIHFAMEREFAGDFEIHLESDPLSHAAIRHWTWNVNRNTGETSHTIRANLVTITRPDVSAPSDIIFDLDNETVSFNIYTQFGVISDEVVFATQSNIGASAKQIRIVPRASDTAMSILVLGEADSNGVSLLRTGVAALGVYDGDGANLAALSALSLTGTGFFLDGTSLNLTGTTPEIEIGASTTKITIGPNLSANGATVQNDTNFKFNTKSGNMYYGDSSHAGMSHNFGTSQQFVIDNDTGNIASTAIIETSNVFKVSGNQVVGARGAAVADATGAGDVVAQLNTLLARLRTHGLIAT